jgi:hypothetical protein
MQPIDGPMVNLHQCRETFGMYSVRAKIVRTSDHDLELKVREIS